VLELGIDVPVMRAESSPAGGVILYLYGGRTVVWDPAPALTPSAASDPVTTQDSVPVGAPLVGAPPAGAPHPKTKSRKKGS